MEHSFQLVTAQISPHESTSNGFPSSQQSRFQRASISSSQSSSGDTNEVVHKVRYRRSTSVPRNQNDTSLPKETKVKLKSRSKSDWTVCNSNVRKVSNDEDGATNSCQACSCTPHPQSSPSPSSHQSCSKSSKSKPSSRYNPSCLKNNQSSFERTMSDSDINSDVEDGSLEEKEPRKFSTSKSLHDFNQHQQESGFDWTTSEPRLCSSSTKILSLQRQNLIPSTTPDSIIRNNVLVRPLTSTSQHPHSQGKYVARIQRGSEPELNSLVPSTSEGRSGERDPSKKRTSLRTSLKNIFSLKKRYSGVRGRGESTTTSNYYRVVYAENNSSTETGGMSTHTTNCTASTNCTPEMKGISISPLIQYLHRMPSYLELVMFSVRETTV